jgi:NADH-quinone oxidoreductase subunit N
MLFALTGMMALVSSYDLITMYLAIELLSLSLYVLAAFKRNSAFSTEAGLKYFILGAFSSGLLLFGSSLIYGFTGTTQFEELAKLMAGISETPHLVSTGLVVGVVFIAIALLFKASAAPFHMWAIDVYEGAPTIVSTFFAVVPKIAILGLFTRIFYFSFYDLIDSWQQIIVLCSLGSMVLAAFVALQQKKIKRFLAYSSVGHVGYLLIGFATGTVEGVQGMLLYSLIYIVTTLGAWTFLLSTERHASGRAVYLTDLGSLSNTNPLLAISFACIMLSMAGVPPLAGFSAKMYVFFAAMEGKMFMLAILGILSSVIGAFYYMRFIKIMYFENMKTWTLFAPIGREQSLVLGTSTLFLVGFFLYPTPFLVLSHKMALSICL